MFTFCCIVSLAAGVHLLSIPNHGVTLPGFGELKFTKGWGQPLVGAALVIFGGKCLYDGYRGMA